MVRKTRFGVVLCVALGFALVAGAVAQAGYYDEVMADAPEGYWRFEENVGATTAIDWSGNGKDGTYTLGVTQAAVGVLDPGSRAADFDGSSGYVQLPGTWGGTGWNEGTVEAWVNSDGLTGNFQAIVATPSGGFAHFQLHSGGSTGFYGGKFIPTHPAVPGTWQHVVLVEKPGDNRLYINGVAVETDPATWSQISASSDVEIGRGHVQTRWFNGRIDEVAIYKTALSEERILAHYNATKSPYELAVKADNPDTYYRFNETSGTTATDEVMGGPRNATYVNTDMAATGPCGGTLGPAKGFDGSSSYVDVPDLGGGSNAKYTVEMWTNADIYGGLRALFAGDGWSAGDLHLNYSYQNVENAISGNTTPWPTQSMASAALGTWNHLVVGYDAPADEAKFYINGQHVGTTITNGATAAIFGPANIGAWDTAGSNTQIRFFDGEIDEFALYQGTILPADRVLAHYHAANPEQCTLVETGGPLSGGNLAAASAGAAAFAKDVGGYPVTTLNDETFGNSSSWYGATDLSFAGIDLGGMQTIDHIGLGRSNTADYSDRCLGNYTIQYTTVPNPDADTPMSDWVTLHSLEYLSGSPSSPALRHLYSFPAVQATGVRIITDRNESLGPHMLVIDEIEVYNGHPLTLAETGGTFSTDRMNLGRTGTPFAAASYNSGSHTISHLNDGLYGNSNSWIGYGTDSWAAIDLGGLFQIDGIAWGRDNGGEGTAFTDRCMGIYTVQYTAAADPQTTSDWTTIGQLIYPDFDGKALRHLYDFDMVAATGVRILVSSQDPKGHQICIDELEVYGIPEPCTLTLLGLGGLGLVARRRRR